MKPQTIDEYIAGFSPGQQAKLTELRSILKKALPDTAEAIKWGDPAIINEDGMILLIFSGHKHHINLVATPRTKQALENDLVDYKTGKGSVQLVYDKPLPVSLIKKIASYRKTEYLKHGIKWMKLRHEGAVYRHTQDAQLPIVLGDLLPVYSSQTSL